MAKAQTPAPAEAKPTIGLGPCLYYSSASDPPSAAIVTKAGNIVSLVCFPFDAVRPSTRDTVRHVSDPDNRKYAELNLGFWDYTDEQKTLMELARASKAGS